MPKKKVVKTPVPEAITTITTDNLLSIVRILLAHRVYFTMANPTHSNMAIHVRDTDVVKVRELLPELFPAKKAYTNTGQTAYVRLSGAADRARLQA